MVHENVVSSLFSIMIGIRKCIDRSKLIKSKYTSLYMILTNRLKNTQRLQDRLDQLREWRFHAQHEEEFYRRLGIYEKGWASELEIHMGVINVQLFLQAIKKMILRDRLKH